MQRSAIGNLAAGRLGARRCEWISPAKRSIAARSISRRRFIAADPSMNVLANLIATAEVPTGVESEELSISITQRLRKSFRRRRYGSRRVD